MAWRLARWKDCDGGCSTRSPTFPDLNNRGSVPGRHPDYMAGDRYKLADGRGASPDGTAWVGGNQLHKELWGLYERVGRRAERITLPALKALPNFGTLFEMDWPMQGAWKGNAVQWFLDRDFGWPVRGDHVQAILDRCATLGIWDPTLYDPGLDYVTTYSDDERKALGQEFHVDADMTDAQRARVPAACCHYWERV